MGMCQPCDSRMSRMVNTVKEVVKEAGKSKDTDTDIDYVRDRVNRVSLRNSNKNGSPLVFEDNVPRQLRSKAIKRYYETNSAALERKHQYNHIDDALWCVAVVTGLVGIMSIFVSATLNLGMLGIVIPVFLTITLSIVFIVCDMRMSQAHYTVKLTKDELKALKGNVYVRTSPPSKVTALPEVAGEILNQIEGSPVWNSEYLALERLQLNLDEEFTQITRVCRKLESMREMIKSHKGSNFDDPALRSELKFRKTAYAEAYAVVERRVATLYAYYIRLGEVENIIKQLDAASELRDTRNAFDDLLSEVALSELATAHVDSLRVNLDALKENLEAQLQFIRVNVVNNPYLDRPLALQN